MADEKIPGRHPNQDKWDRRRAAHDATLGSTDQKRSNLRRTEEALSRETNPSARRSLEIKREEQARVLDESPHGRSGR